MTEEEFATLKIGDIIEFKDTHSRDWHFRGIVKKINKNQNGFWISMTWGKCGIFDKEWMSKNIITRLGPVKILERYALKLPHNESFTTKSGDIASSEIRHVKI